LVDQLVSFVQSDASHLALAVDKVHTVNASTGMEGAPNHLHQLCNVRTERLLIISTTFCRSTMFTSVSSIC